MNRSIDQWKNCDPHAMAVRQGEAAIVFAFIDAKQDILALYSLVERVSRLNADAGEIGAGMLKSLVEDANRILKVK